MASLVVKKSNGELLFDTSKITYGLVKSGNMSLIGYWSRRRLKSAQLDPSDGSNWTVSSNSTGGDGIWGFTLTNVRSPIVFLVGSGTLNGTARTGNTITFYYSNSGVDTRFYCFDLMTDTIPGSPYLKTYTESGVLTFNSLQTPLNIVATCTPPGPGALQPGTTDLYINTYAGGRGGRRQVQVDGVNNREPQVDSIYDFALSPGVEYAAHLPWSRGATYLDVDVYGNGTGSTASYAVIEGAYGRVGGISFMFGASAGTTTAPLPPSSRPGYTSIFTSSFPQALVITTANLPFPYN